MVYHAAARGIAIDQVESLLEGNLDLRGFLGLAPQIRNGYQGIRLTLRVKANVSDEQFRELTSLGPSFRRFSIRSSAAFPWTSTPNGWPNPHRSANSSLLFLE